MRETVRQQCISPLNREITFAVSAVNEYGCAMGVACRVLEDDLTLYEAYNAEEAFWTTSSYCILPISMIDGRKIGTSYPGPAAKRLLSAWSRAVGLDIVGQARKFCDNHN